MNIIQIKLDKLRTLMQEHQVDMYLAPSIDAHCNEYVPECFNRRPWISGFSGSAGEALITHDHAYLSTDGRYFLQAEAELDPAAYTLLKQTGFAPHTEVWLSENGAGKTLGIDPRVVGIGRARSLEQLMQNAGGKLKFIDNNLIDECRHQCGESLELPQNPVFRLEEQYTGQSLADKLCWVRTEIRAHNVDYLVLNLLDEIAWLFNLRGEDVLFNPLFISYALISPDSATLFVDSNKLDAKLKHYLAEHGIIVTAYTQFGPHIAAIHGSIWLDEKTSSYYIYDKIDAKNEILFTQSPIVHKKAAKNPIEIAGTKAAHIKDAVALTKFFYWLDNNWQTGVDEIICANKLAGYRAEQTNSRGASFNTISSFGSNGAIIHYAVNPTTNKKIDDSNLYLLDSGGQYLEGTTDVTRVVHLGQPTAAQKRHYTLVLKGHLALARAIFPQGTCGEHLDTLARQYLWADYLDYRHGTGHGVGSFLCVHEGPQRISRAASNTPLVPGMIVSDEPGVYLPNQYGIRIENLCVVVEAIDNASKNSEYGPFYQFENLTLFPYCRKLLDAALLNAVEIAQITDYYTKIKNTVLPLVDNELQTWLLNEMNLF